ncbi:MAG: HEAT repeat domain-containing protein, partial [Bacteroidales bacterium]|nr:HEAT repeat domain-containing protein [Bacteroidales bacterium]
MKRSFIFLLLLTVTLSLAAREKRPAVAVVVDPATRQALAADVDAFVQSMELVGKRGILVVDRWNQPDSIRAELKRLYDTDGLEGAVLVGNIPIPMVRDAHHLTTAFKMNPSRDWQDSSVPSDRLYDDFDLRFDYLKQDAEKPQLHYYSLRFDSPQVIHCDIWTSRIKPPQIPGQTATEAIAQYLRKAVKAKAEPRTP